MHIYLAGSGIQPWSRPLRQLCELTDSRFAILNKFSRRAKNTPLLWAYDSGDVSSDIMRTYAEYVQSLGDPRVEFALSGTKRVFHDLDFIDDRSLAKHPYWAEILAPADLKYAVCTVLELTEDYAVGISIQRSAREGPGDTEKKEFLQRLSIHFQGALRIQGLRVGWGRAEPSGARDLIYHAILRRDGILLDSSAWFDDAVLRPGLLQLQNGRLTLGESAQAVEFDRARVHAASGQVVEFALSHDLAMTLLPLVDDAGFHFPPDNLAVVLRRQDKPPPIQRATRRYGLTRAEAEVAKMLAEGEKLSAIADRRCASIHTVRTQAKTLMQKMEARSQGEVVSRLLRASDGGQ